MGKATAAVCMYGMDRMLFTRLKNEDKNTVLKNLTFGLSSGRAATKLKLLLVLLWLSQASGVPQTGVTEQQNLVSTNYS